MIAALAISAFAQECRVPPLTAPPETVSVAWVSPLGRRARAASWLYVVATSDLRAFADDQGKGQVGRTLQWLGARRTAKTPRRPYKVVVFDSAPGEMCRPIPSDELVLEGVQTCDEGPSRPRGAYDGCGYLTDRADGQPSIQVYRAQWRVLAVDGFCVLPLDRFLAVDR